MLVRTLPVSLLVEKDTIKLNIHEYT
jgi:hypothetical protein